MFAKNRQDIAYQIPTNPIISDAERVTPSGFWAYSLVISYIIRPSHE